MSVRVVLNFAAIRAAAGSSAAERLLERLGDALVSDAYDRAPKDTGAGADSIHYEIEHEPDGAAVVKIGWDEEHPYMIDSELGNSRQPARPFLRPSAIQHRTL